MFHLLHHPLGVKQMKQLEVSKIRSTHPTKNNGAAVIADSLSRPNQVESTGVVTATA